VDLFADADNEVVEWAVTALDRAVSTVDVSRLRDGA